ncbi:vacuolar protein-sorting protein bro-1-like [Pipra filicauda]|uniref:Vacuolar protein-sorting protein bro-1-like n=1 Tax=Pipra filicauda TaxID=649802 RepID=A0A7R5L7R2_9PASS|nr:vacuolar protein-sorting protein bro-1-like [Pipra filicauda]
MMYSQYSTTRKRVKTEAETTRKTAPGKLSKAAEKQRGLEHLSERGRAGAAPAGGSPSESGSGLCPSPQPPSAVRGAEGSKERTFEVLRDEAAGPPGSQPLIVPVPLGRIPASATPPPRITPENAGLRGREGSRRQRAVARSVSPP